MRLGANQKNVLKWMADNPFYCSNNTAMNIARKVAEECGGGELTVYQAIRLLIKRGVVDEEVDFRGYVKGLSINWNCHSLPEEIAELAPQHVKDVVGKTNEKLKSGEYLSVDPFGAGIIQPATPSDEAELWQKLAAGVGSITSDDLAEAAQRLVEADGTEVEEGAGPEPAQPQETVATENAVTVEPTVVKTADGKGLSISLTINLNL